MAPSALQVGDTVELPQVRVQKKIKSMQVSLHALWSKVLSQMYEKD